MPLGNGWYATHINMLKIKNLRGECQQCGKPIEFHAEATGTTAECPHCGQPTELLLAAPPEENSPVRTKAIVFGVIAVIILIGGLIGAVIALKRAQGLKERSELAVKTDAQKPTTLANPFAQEGFRASSVTLDRATNNSLVYAVGTIDNLTNRPRFGVKVELELLDDAGSKVGEAKDYRSVLEPNAQWKFRAMVVEKRTVSAKIVGIKEDK